LKEEDGSHQICFFSSLISSFALDGILMLQFLYSLISLFLVLSTLTNSINFEWMQCDHGYGVTKMSESTGLMEDPKLGIVCTINDLHVGKTITFQVPTKDPSSLPHFLPREVADSIPFSVEEFPYLLQLFSISQNSPQAKAIKTTLEDCESKPPIKQVKFCATSLESMVDSVRAFFGSESPFKALATTSLTKSNYTFLDVKEVSTSKTMVLVCHNTPYPYAVFYCHDLGDTKVFEISLGGHQNGETAAAFFVCHMDTSGFAPDNMVFRLLGIKQGTSPVCHYVFPQDLLWVPY
jgi:hypothetical protein